MLRFTHQAARLFRKPVLQRTQPIASFGATAGAQKASIQRNPYAEQMYEAWVQDPSSVHPSWDYYFNYHQKHQNVNTKELIDNERVKEQTELLMKAYVIIQRYKSRGHETAQLDPLRLEERYGQFNEFGKQRAHSKIEEGVHIEEKQWDVPFALDRSDYLNEIAFFLGEKDVWTLREIRQYCQKVYTGKIGVEYTHILSSEQRIWLQERVEKLGLAQISKDQRLKTLGRLCKNEAFNLFLKNKFNTSKRFGIEGCDSFISGLDCLVDSAVQHGIEHVVIGMPHRGRLNTLACVLGKPMEEIFAEFQDIKETVPQEEVWGHAGDVKYHLGVSQDREYPGGKKINMRIIANPSHLEAVDPCVYGATRAIQDFKVDSEGTSTLAVLVHGDAALCGQGVVYESLQMADLKSFSPRGVVHVVVNNQIGFTTTPREFRSGYQSTEIAKCVESPIFHVNADEPDLVDEVMKVALEFRQCFHKDVVVDIIGYRRYGHNELDQPMFTQPIMYRTIMAHPPVVELYSQKLIAEGLTTREAINEKMIQHNDALEASYAISRQETFNAKDWHAKTWEQVREPEKFGAVKNTSVPVPKLREIGQKLTDIPEDFNIHPQLKKIFQQRRQSLDSGTRVDMATAESLAFGTLLYEGFGVRLSGQDVERGTFSQRHAVLIDQKVDRMYVPFNSLLTEDQIKKNWFQVRNSHLSEYGCLGFEYGYSITNPNVLCLWEAQFGDFANGAQIMIDNYIATGETKWGVQTGLVLLLPHGYDGQGPEHSSARLERFLQLSDDNYLGLSPNRTERLKRQVRNCNWQVVVCSNSVNYFHALRRQIRRDFRKPLIALTSKKLLRHKGASSDLIEFENQKRFSVCYQDVTPNFPSDQVKRVIICSGQVYYDIQERREQIDKKDVAIIRIEQLAPFPYDFLKELICTFKNADFVWCQEEQKNQGAWDYVQPRIQTVLNELHSQKTFTQAKKVQYIGRKVSASTAVGSSKVHQEELNVFLTSLFNY